MDRKKDLLKIAQAAREASRQLARTDTNRKNRALQKMAEGLEKESRKILAANRKDLGQAAAHGLSGAMLDRLKLNEKRIAEMASGLRAVAALPDPVGEIPEVWSRPNGLRVGRMRIPLGVICIIYEARPNVTSDAAGLTLKSGNAAILRGGSEAINSNLAIARVLQAALAGAGLPPAAVSIVPWTERELIGELLKLEELIDLVIPRGGEGLIRYVVERSRIPVIKHYKGVCHIYVAASADFDLAEKVILNAKVQRPGVCNALETLLVDRKAAAFLPRIAKKLKAARVELRGCPETRKHIPRIKKATEEDWSAEYLDLILSVRMVDGLGPAIRHIEKYGSAHTEAIITRDYEEARRFVREVQSSLVLVNASTRFNDGGELGLGAEIGISTTKLHAFGPMGLRELTTQKFFALGEGQIRE
jgi:glutamate-5-semialdehyde dehydrogenase